MNLWQHYFLQHVRRTGQPHLFVTTQPLKVFKKVTNISQCENLIASLLIPVNTRIVVGENERYGLINKVLGVHAEDPTIYCSSCKLRASRAYVTHIAEQVRGLPVKRARAIADIDFIYTPGHWVWPTKRFNASAEVCASGIHFFLTLIEAKRY